MDHTLIASGPFMPSPLYAVDRHENTVDGNYAGDVGQSLSAFVDGMGTSDKRHPTAWWKDGRDFEAMLSGHADHKVFHVLDWKLAGHDR